jgi:hypothetical protein
VTAVVVVVVGLLIESQLVAHEHLHLPAAHAVWFCNSHVAWVAPDAAAVPVAVGISSERLPLCVVPLSYLSS